MLSIKEPTALRERASMTIYTIGYEGSGLEAFLSCLKENNIELLAGIEMYQIKKI